MQIQQHSWLEQHLAFYGSKVHFLGQILDYNIQNLYRAASKKLFDLLEQALFYLRWYGICIPNSLFRKKELFSRKILHIIFTSLVFLSFFISCCFITSLMNSLVYVDIWKYFTGIFHQACKYCSRLLRDLLGMYYLVSTYIHILCAAFEKINVHKKRHTRCYISSALTRPEHYYRWVCN